ncbi:MAG: formylglycine-generating enzyme family protein [Polyangiales bacterium]
MTPLVGLADLVRIVARLPPAEAREAAGMLGFDPPAPPVATSREAARAPTATLSPRSPEPVSSKEHFAAAVAAVEAQRSAAAPSAFWRVERYEPAPDEAPAEAAMRASSEGESPLLPSERVGGLFAVPETPSVTPWRRLWPVLHEALQTHLSGRDPDVHALVRCWSRGEPVARLPRVRRRAWAPRAAVWIDASARLTPLGPDQERAVRGLRRVFGAALRERWLGRTEAAQARQSPQGWLAGERPDPTTPVLVLGDLGQVGGDEGAQWRRGVQRLRRSGIRVTAVVPWSTRRRRWCASWGCRVVSWEHRVVTRQEGDAVTELLALASTAVFVQPGLLRSLRWLMPGVGLEAELRAWGHPAVAGADSSGLMLRRDALAAMHAARRELPEVLRSRADALIDRWHEHMPRELVYGEALLRAQASGGEVRSKHDAAARAFVQRLGAMLARSAAAEHAGWRGYGRALLDALPPSAERDLPALRQIRDAVRPERAWALRQVGDALVVEARGDVRWPSEVEGEGSPVAVLEAAGAEVLVDDGETRTQRVLASGKALPLPAREGARVAVRAARGTLHAAPWVRESWASAAGRDAYGLWAEVTVGEVRFRMRWVPPGRFVMGSPKGEAGRWEDEVQHEVVLTHGYWLGETPVTQALWEVVMRSNPSHFVSADRPVEQVRWQECVEFLRALNGRVAGLGARLPTEAEWERACRAGATTATWVGDLEIYGESNAPVLDGLAWYGGNSGRGFELKNGADISNRREKQYPDTRAGTHPVGQKAANPLGFYDLLGNVWEWCSDWYRAYDVAPSIDPTGPELGTRRVLRGGSWSRQARNVRAATRNSYDPGYRYDYLGFRLARSQSVLMPVGEGEAPRRGRRGGAEGRSKRR